MDLKQEQIRGVSQKQNEDAYSSYHNIIGADPAVFRGYINNNAANNTNIDSDDLATIKKYDKNDDTFNTLSDDTIAAIDASTVKFRTGNNGTNGVIENDGLIYSTKGFTNDLSNTITHNGIAIGTNNIANGNSSIAEGNATTAFHVKSHSSGTGTKTGEDYQTVIGRFNQSTVGQFVVGSGTDDATRSNAMVVNGSTTFIENLDGNNTTVNNLVVNSSVTLPADMTGTMQNLQIGNADDNGNLTVIGKIQHGNGTSAMSVANGNYAHAQGNNTRAEGDYSHSEGNNAKSIGLYSHAEGNNTVTKGAYSHAEGNNSTAYSDAYGSHVEGNGAQIIQGTYAHAEGTGCIISGDGHYGHAEGVHTTVLHQGGHTGGIRTRTSENYQTVIGEYNADEGGQFIVGCGTSDDARANAMVVNGNTTNINKLIAKSVEINGTTPLLKNTYYTAKITDTTETPTTGVFNIGDPNAYNRVQFLASGSGNEPYSSPDYTITISNCIATSIGEISVNNCLTYQSPFPSSALDKLFSPAVVFKSYNSSTKVLTFFLRGMPSWFDGRASAEGFRSTLTITYPTSSTTTVTKSVIFY